MKKRFTLLLAACALAALTACGGTAASDSDSAPSSRPESVGAPESASAVDYTACTDEEFLTAVHTWQSSTAPGVIFTYDEGGTGRFTTDNERTVYEMEWTLADNVLTYDIKDYPYTNNVQSFTVLLDKKSVLYATIGESETVFVPLGAVPFPDYEENKPEELCGVWVYDRDSSSLRVWYLNPKEERSWYGVYDSGDNVLTREKYFDDWDVVGDELVYVFENGTETRYTWQVDGDTLILSDESGSFTFLRMDPTGVTVE